MKEPNSEGEDAVEEVAVPFVHPIGHSIGIQDFQFTHFVSRQLINEFL